MVMGRGRAAYSGPLRTPLLIRQYLAGHLEFPLDEPRDQATRTAEGDYVPRMHRCIKLRIRGIDPSYQYLRKHSFLSLVNGLSRLGWARGLGGKKILRNEGQARSG